MFSRLLSSQSTLSFSPKSAAFEKDEAIFYRRVKQALPTYMVFPNIGLGSLIKLKEPNARKQKTTFDNIREERVDFAIFNRKYELVCVIHLREEIETETKYLVRKTLEEAGIKQLFWRRDPYPSFEQILNRLRPNKETRSGKHKSLQDKDKNKDKDKEKNNNSHPELDAHMTKKSHEGDTLPPREHDNPQAMSVKTLLALCHEQRIQHDYPHIWKRISLLLATPKHLENYLNSLFVENRPIKRQGFPALVLEEIRAIQEENLRCLRALPLTS